MDWAVILAAAGIAEPPGRPELIAQLQAERQARLDANGGMEPVKVKPKPKVKRATRKRSQTGAQQQRTK